jgi:anaerobic selenocysteine-containing dehydrogenase
MELPVLGDNTRLDQPHVMKTVDPSIFSRGVMKVHMNRSTAEKLGLSDGDSIDIASERGRLHGLELHVTDTVAPDCLAVPLGFGHRNCTAWSNGRGLNPKPIMKADIDPLTGAADWWCTSVALR